MDNARGLEVAGDFAYVAAHGSGLKVVNISDPMKPVLVGSHALPGGETFAVRVSGGYAYAPVIGLGVVVVDVSNPTNPVSVATCAVSGWVQSLQLVNTNLYLACGDHLE